MPRNLYHILPTYSAEDWSIYKYRFHSSKWAFRLVCSTSLYSHNMFTKMHLLLLSLSLPLISALAVRSPRAQAISDRCSTLGDGVIFPDSSPVSLNSTGTTCAWYQCRSTGPRLIIDCGVKLCDCKGYYDFDCWKFPVGEYFCRAPNATGGRPPQTTATGTPLPRV